MRKPPPNPRMAEHVYRRGAPTNRLRLGVLVLALSVIGGYLAVTKELPFGSDYRVRAVFGNAANIRADSPVRIAGVNVGEVESVRSVGDNAEVTFTVEDGGRPIREDAYVEIRPRIFLEGNFFLDLQPGSPSADELEDGGTIPVTRTATAVQLDQILTALQKPDRRNLSDLLDAYGEALNSRPTAAEDADQDPDARGETAAQAINDAFRYGEAAGRDSAIVSEALLGTEPGDLSRLIRSQARVLGALSDRESQLQGLVSNLNTTAGAFAAESEALEESVRLLAPALETAEPALRNLNATFPPLRAFARDIRPGIEELPGTIEAAGPWLRQATGLLSFGELGGIARELRRTARPLGTVGFQGRRLMPQITFLSRCVTDTLLPAGNAVIDDSGPGFDFTTGVPNYKEFLYAAVNSAGESQSFDGNGPYLRFQTGGGPQLASADQPNGGFENDKLYSYTIEPPIGTRPRLTTKPAFRTDVRCHTSGAPDLNGPAADIGPPSPEAVP